MTGEALPYSETHAWDLPPPSPHQDAVPEGMSYGHSTGEQQLLSSSIFTEDSFQQMSLLRLP